MPDLQAAQEPTFYFIGVTTGQSSIMKVFPKWADALGLKVAIRGIDLAPHSPTEDYRKVIEFLKTDSLSLGALVTTHKLDLFTACRDIFDYIDPYAEKLSEVSSISKKAGGNLEIGIEHKPKVCEFCAHAKDPISSGLALESFVPPRFWAEHGGEVLLLGAGGSSLAMSLYFSREEAAGNMPRRITITNRSEPRLVSARAALAGGDKNIEFRFLHCPSAADNDRLISALPPCSLVVNAT